MADALPTGFASRVAALTVTAAAAAVLGHRTMLRLWRLERLGAPVDDETTEAIDHLHVSPDDASARRSQR